MLSDFGCVSIISYNKHPYFMTEKVCIKQYPKFSYRNYMNENALEVSVASSITKSLKMLLVFRIKKTLVTI